MFALQFALKFVINMTLLDREAMKCAFHFVEVHSKDE